MPAGYGIQDQKPASTTAFSANRQFAGVAYRSQRTPDYHVYVFNISARSFDSFGKLTNRKIAGVREEDPDTVTEVDGAVGNLGNNRKYRYFTSFSQPMLIPDPDVDSSELRHREQDAVRYVVDLINPDNVTHSLDTYIDPNRATAVNRDMSMQGIFFSLSNPPKREDIEKAYARMEKYYTMLLEEASTLEMTDKALLSEKLKGNPDFSFAAAYYGKDTTWHRKQVRPVQCSNCGEDKPTGKKFHMTSYGKFCVEPTVEAWKAAVLSGMKTMDEVPEELRWREAKQEPVPAPTQPTEENTRPSRR